MVLDIARDTRLESFIEKCHFIMATLSHNSMILSNKKQSIM